MGIVSRFSMRTMIDSDRSSSCLLVSVPRVLTSQSVQAFLPLLPAACSLSPPCTAFLPSANMSKPDKKMPDDEDILRAFRACPELDVCQARVFVPAIMEAIEPLADALCVSWPSVLLAVLVAVASLAPEDSLEIAPSVTVRSVIWACLLHPGATNSSGVVGCIACALEKLCQRDFREAQAVAKAAAAAADAEYVEPLRRQIVAGGGSLASTGLDMSRAHNRGAALVAEPELDNVVQWFTSEASVDSGAPAKLWDGRAWHRSVLDKMRAFTILFPWLSIISAGHVPEVFKATLKDAFGLRQRLTVSFPRPSWRTIAEIRAACGKLSVPSHTPDDYVAALLYPAMVNSLKRPGGQVYKPDEADGAAKTVDDKFDSHMDLQKDAFLKPHQHEVSKKHGKLRTKFDRLVIAVHLLNTYCVVLQELKSQPGFDMTGTWGQDVTPCAKIAKSEVEMAYFLCSHYEDTWDTLDFARSGHTLPREPPPPEETQADQVAQQLDEEHDRMVSMLASVSGRSWKDADLDFFIGLGMATFVRALRSREHTQAGITNAVLLSVMQYLLGSPARWFQYASSSATQRALWRLMQVSVTDSKLTMYVTCLAAKLLAGLGVGILVRTIKVSGGGQPNWWFLSMPVVSGLHEVLDLLGVHAASTPSLDAYTARVAQPAEKPIRAPDIDWEACVFSRSDQDQVLSFLSLARIGMQALAVPASAADDMPPTVPGQPVAVQPPPSAEMGAVAQIDNFEDEEGDQQEQEQEEGEEEQDDDVDMEAVADVAELEQGEDEEGEQQQGVSVDGDVGEAESVQERAIAHWPEVGQNDEAFFG
jgi:hypothetical protein